MSLLSSFSSLISSITNSLNLPNIATATAKQTSKQPLSFTYQAGNLQRFSARSVATSPRTDRQTDLLLCLTAKSPPRLTGGSPVIWESFLHHRNESKRLENRTHHAQPVMLLSCVSRGAMAMLTLQRFEASTRTIADADAFHPLFARQKEFRGRALDKTWRWLYLAVFRLPEHQYEVALGHWKFAALRHESESENLKSTLSNRFKSTLLEAKARTLTTGEQFHAMLAGVQEISAPFRDDPLIMLGIRLWCLPSFEISDARNALEDVVQRQPHRSAALDLLLQYAKEDRALAPFRDKTCPFYNNAEPNVKPCFMEITPLSDEAWQVFCQEAETVQACRLRYNLRAIPHQ
jgi:hypothetical protein